MPDETIPTNKSIKLFHDDISSASTEKAEKSTKRRPSSRRISKQKEAIDTVPTSTDTIAEDSDTEIFEIEESESPLIPLYHLRDEGAMKWVLLSDLCYLLKIKSKDTLLKLVSGLKWQAFRLILLFFTNKNDLFDVCCRCVLDRVQMLQPINVTCYVN